MLGGRLGAVAEDKGDWSFSPGLERDEVGDMRDELCGHTYHKQAMLKKNLKPVPPHGHLGGFFFRLFRGGTTFQATAGGCKKRDGKEDAPKRG